MATQADLARGWRSTRLATLLLLTIFAVTILFLIATCDFPLLDSHPHQMHIPVAIRDKATTEADFEAGFGYQGRLVSGSRTLGTPYTVEWSDDTYLISVSFDEAGKWKQTLGEPFFGLGSFNVPTALQRFKLALRRMGLNVRY